MVSRRALAVMLAALVLSSDTMASAPPRRAGLGGSGIASWYGRFHDGKRMSDGCKFDRRKVSVAHRGLPLGTWIRIHNPDTGAVLAAPVTDRGPYVAGRVLDLSERAAEILGIVHRGTAHVIYEVMPDKPKHNCTGVAHP